MEPSEKVQVTSSEEEGDNCMEDTECDMENLSRRQSVAEARESRKQKFKEELALMKRQMQMVDGYKISHMPCFERSGLH